MAKYITLILTLLSLSNCGEDRCDPTGSFGCEQYTTHYEINIDNQTSDKINVSFKSNKKCASVKGTSKWEAAPNSVLKTSMKFVSQGGGDGCDNWGDDTYTFTVGKCSYKATKNFNLVYDGESCVQDGVTEQSAY